MMFKFDVLIAGAGPAGLASAIVLSRAGLSILVVDKGRRNDFRAGEHLGPTARECLKRLGFEEKGLDQDHYSFAGMRIFWGSDRASYQDALFSLGGLGWVLDRTRFNEQLGEKVEKSNCQFLYETSIQGATPHPDGLAITLRDKSGKRFVQSSFLVDATGRVAKGARLMGAKAKIDDRLIGTCFLQSSDRVDPGQSHKWGHLESCPHGWWFSTEIPGGRRASYWMSDKHLPNIPFLDGLNSLLTQAPQTKALFEQSGDIIDKFQRPAHSQCLDHCAGPRWIAVGDAASSFDPMASEGIAKGLRTGIEGAEAVLSALAGNHTPMLSYDNARKEEYKTHLSLKTVHYRNEQRWTSEPFWAKRQL